MTVYARNDVCAVSISPTHGGCGVTHSRPVVEGAPAKLWALTCHGGCEDYLRHDPLWAATPQNIPETADETDIRLDVEKRNQIEQAARNTQALENLGQLPEALAAALAKFAVQSATPAPVEPAKPAETPVEPAGPDLESLSFDALKQMALDLDVKITRSKAEQVKAIREALDNQPA